MENFILTSVVSRVKDYLKKMDEEFPPGSMEIKQGQKQKIDFSPDLLAMAKTARK